jgi:hypothetical protein
MNRPRAGAGLFTLLIAVAVVAFGCAAEGAEAASYYARTAGAGTITTNWNQNTTWTTDPDCNGAALGAGIFPGAADDVFICSGKTVNITANAQARSVTFMNNVNSSTNLTHGSGISLTVGVGGVTITAAGGGTNIRAWNINDGSATVNGSVALAQSSNNNSRVARINITTGTLDVNGDLTMTAGNAVRAVIDMSGGAGNLFIAGSFSLASGTGTLTPGTSSTVTYDSATTPVTVATGSSIAYHHLAVAKGAGNVANAAATGNLTVGGNLSVTSGTFNIPGITAAVTGASTVAGTLAFVTAATGTRTFTGNITIDPGGAWTNNAINAPIIVRSGLTNNGTFTAGTGLYTFNGTAAQSITGSNGGNTSFANLTLDNANGLSLTGTHDVTVTILLTLTAGPITTGANVLHISNGSAIASAGGTDFVAGNLRKTVGAGGCTTCNFEIGSAAGGPYTPITSLALTGITAGGTLTASTTAAEHPNIATSGIDSALSANRYWTLANAGIAFTDFSATFNWVAADLDVGADTAVFEMQRYSPAAPAAGAWSSTTAAAQNATNIQITGVNGFGDFAVGQPLAAAGGIGRFNAYDTATAAGAVTGFIMTKVAGSAFNVDIIAIRNNRKSIDTGFTGTLRVELLNASDNSGTLDSTTGCNSSWTVIQTLAPDPVFAGADNGRRTLTVTEANAWREARFRIRDFPAGTLIGCSTDAFAIRPASFTASLTDATWDTAGTTRALDNAGGRVHKAGQPFTITITPSPASATNYDGSPAVGTLACIGAGCTNGTLTPGAFAGTGNRVSTTASYSEAGAFNLTLEDRLYAVIDATDGSPADCSAAGRWVCQSPAPVTAGRFVPDRFEFAGANTPQLATFGATACGTRSFTYVGQLFWYASGMLTPSATLNAVNAAGAVTTNYTLDIALSKPAIGEAYADATAPAAGPLNAAGIASATLSPGAGTGTYTAALAGTLSYTRSTTTPVNPFNAAITLTVTATDATDSAVSGNGTIGTPAPLVFNGGGTGIAFDAGRQIRYGRLRIGNASGSQLVPLRVPLELQYYNAGAFATHTADTCTSLSGTNIELGTYTANLNACETSVTVGGFSSGRSTVLLSAPGNANSGSVVVMARLESSVAPGPLTCIAGVSTAVTGADKAHLQGNWTVPTFTQNPAGKATFGVYPGADEVIFIREVFQ